MRLPVGLPNARQQAQVGSSHRLLSYFKCNPAVFYLFVFSRVQLHGHRRVPISDESRLLAEVPQYAGLVRLLLRDGVHITAGSAHLQGAGRGDDAARGEPLGHSARNAKQ